MRYLLTSAVILLCLYSSQAKPCDDNVDKHIYEDLKRIEKGSDVK